MLYLNLYYLETENLSEINPVDSPKGCPHQMWIFTCMQEFQGPLRSLKIKDMKAVLVITDVCGQQ